MGPTSVDSVCREAKWRKVVEGQVIEVDTCPDLKGFANETVLMNCC